MHLCARACAGVRATGQFYKLRPNRGVDLEAIPGTNRATGVQSCLCAGADVTPMLALQWHLKVSVGCPDADTASVSTHVLCSSRPPPSLCLPASSPFPLASLASVSNPLEMRKSQGLRSLSLCYCLPPFSLSFSLSFPFIISLSLSDRKSVV